MNSISMKISTLTDEGFEELKKAVESIMENTGFVVNNQTILGLFEKAGGNVDYEHNKVKLSPELLWGLIAKAPASYTVRGVNGDSYEIGGGKQYYHAIVTDPFIADYPSGEKRRPCLDDVILNTRIMQSKPEVYGASLMNYPVTDISGPSSKYRAMEAFLLNHAKHNVVLPVSYASFKEWLEIIKILSGGRPLKDSGMLSVGIPILSPLTITKDNCDIILESAKNGFPVKPTTCPMAGSTSPYTYAGTLIQSLAESFAILCTVQVINPGSPFLFGFGASVTDMQSGRDMYYTVADKVLWKLPATTFAKRLGLPVGVETGGAMSSRYDMQSGAEGMLMALTAALSGADVLAGPGSCLNANGLSAEFILSHYAFLEIAAHLKKGFSLSGIDRDLESIEKQGSGGHFLTDDQTLEYLRSPEFFSPRLFDISGETGEGMSFLESAHEEAERIGRDFISPAPEEVAGALREYFDKLCGGL